LYDWFVAVLSRSYRMKEEHCHEVTLAMRLVENKLAMTLA
jgi:hypothetical protein